MYRYLQKCLYRGLCPKLSTNCLNYAECSRKSLVGKMYEIVNEQVKFLTSQYIGTCKSAYTKGYALN